MTYRLQPTKPRPLAMCGMYCDRDARWRWYPHAHGYPRPWSDADYWPIIARIDRLDAHTAEHEARR